MSDPIMYIVSNQIECLKCGDKPFSMHRHHYSTCKCGEVSADGGQSYLRRVGSNWKELAIVMNETHFIELTEAVQESIDTGRNALGIACAALRSLRDLGYPVKQEINL